MDSIKTFIPHSIVVDNEGNSTVSFVLGGEGVQVTHESPNYEKVVNALRQGINPALYLSFGGAVEPFGGVKVEGGQVFYGGEPIHSHLVSTILRWQREGRDTTGLERFLERLQGNPSRRSREQLFEWTEASGLTIDEDGYFYGFKGVNREALDAGDAEAGLDDVGFRFVSVHSGKAFVNGVEVEGQVPNAVGDTISMPREWVQDDPTVACSHGLHVGSHGYASSFGGGDVLVVRVDPANVVSVPRDSGCQKLRVCEYTVVEVHERPEPVLDVEPEATLVPDDDDVLPVEDVLPEVPRGFLARLRARLGGNA